MGVTSHDIAYLDKFVIEHNTKNVLELGAQNNFFFPGLPAPYMREWYEMKGVFYRAIDLSGEDGCGVFDLAKRIDETEGFEISKALKIDGVFMELMGYDKVNDAVFEIHLFDLVTDFGTSEHIGIDGKFSWEAIYNCWKNKFDLCKIGGFIISENPKTGHWPGHGFQYYTPDFYVQLSQVAGLRLIDIDEVCAMGNCRDGKNVFCVMEKLNDAFPDLEAFKLLDLRLS